MILPIGKDVKNLDLWTMDTTPIRSIDLMERASMAFARRFIKRFSKDIPVLVFCGNGNNGGDGLSIGRLLLKAGYSVQVFCNNSTGTPDFYSNLQRLQQHFPDAIKNLEEFQPAATKRIFIDALFGYGLNRPIADPWLKWLKKLHSDNHSFVLSVDLPSGLGEDFISDEGVFADETWTFHAPKRVFFSKEGQQRVGKLEVLDIQLRDDNYSFIHPDHFWLRPSDFAQLIPENHINSNKKANGSLMVISGSDQYRGAPLLVLGGAQKTGVGYLHLLAPDILAPTLAVRNPEFIFHSSGTRYSQKWSNTISSTALVIGPGLGLRKATESFFWKCLKSTQNKPKVIDADALTFLSHKENWPDLIGKNVVLTPHPGERKRLFAEGTDYALFCKKHDCVLVLKDRFTRIFAPDGVCYYSTTGSPILAKGGSGDILTGLIGGLLARGISTVEATKRGVMWLGLASKLQHERMQSSLGRPIDLLKSI